MLSVLQIGQSNAVGLGIGGLLGPALDCRVQAWNNENTTVERKRGTSFVTPVLGTKPLNHTGAYQNAGVWFASKLAKLTQQNVKFMLVAKGATGIEAYDERTANPFLLNEVFANWAASNSPPADFLIHCGHENNRFDTLAAYSNKQDQVIASLLAHGVISAATVIVLTGLAEREADHKALNDNVLRPYCAARGYAYASSSELPQQVYPDLSHFTGRAYVQMGLDRIFEALPAGAVPCAPLPPELAHYGVTANGEYWIYTDGRKVVEWMPVLEWVYPHSLYTKWDYPIKFNNTPCITHSLSSMQSVAMDIAKVGGSNFMLDNFNSTWAQIRLQSNSLFTAGTEKMGVILRATEN